MGLENRSDKVDSLRCVLAATGDGPRTVFAQEPGNRDGPLIHVDDAPNGKSGLVCPDCQKEVVARHGSVRRHSFAHWKRGECAFAGETAVHRLAKDIIAKQGNLRLPAIEIIDVGGKQLLKQATTVSFDQVFVERYAGSQRPDLIGITFDKYGGEHRLLIEIHVTNPVYGKRKRKLALQKNAVLEIDLSKLDRDIDEEGLARAVLQEAPRKWVLHPRRDRLQQEADARLKKEEDDRKRRQSHAILQRHERDIARREALRVQPTLLEGKEADQALRDLEMWRLLQFQDVILAVKSEDRIFKVPGDLWRTRVMSVFAPWLGRDEVTDRDFLKIVPDAARDLQELGWVKDAYKRPERDFTGHGFRERDFVEDACFALLEGVAAVCAEKPGGAPAWDLKTAIEKRWEVHKDVRKAVLSLSCALRPHGANLIHDATILQGEVEVDRYLMDAAAKSVRPPAGFFEELVWEATYGHPRYGRRADVDLLGKLGLGLVTEHGEVVDAADLLRRLADVKKRPLQAVIDAKTKAAAHGCRAHFEKLQSTWPGLEEILKNSVVGSVLLAGEKAPELQIEIDMDLSRPQVTAEEKLESALRPARVFAKDLARAASFSEFASDQATKEWIFYTASRIAAKSSDRSAGLPGLARDDDWSGIRTLMQTLHEKSQKPGYGEDFQRRALGSVPTGEDRSLLEMILAGHRVSYLKALADVRQRPVSPTWVQI